MGRPRKPKRLKELQGTFRADREPDPASIPPGPAPGWPRQPRGLTPEAKKIWTDLGSKYLVLRVLYETDGELLGNLCSAQVLAMKATRGYQKQGLTVSNYGQKTVNPLIKVANAARAQVQTHLAEFNRRIAALEKSEGLERTLRKLEEERRKKEAGGGAAPDADESFLFGRPRLVAPK